MCVSQPRPVMTALEGGDLLPRDEILESTFSLSSWQRSGRLSQDPEALDIAAERTRRGMKFAVESAATNRQEAQA